MDEKVTLVPLLGVAVAIDSKALVEILLPLIELAIIPSIGIIRLGRQPLTKNLQLV